MEEPVAHRLTVDGAEVLVLGDEDAVAREGSRRIVDGLRAAIDLRGEAHIALTGGSSAVTLYRVLDQDPWRSALPWDSVHLWWGDERYVPRDHPESNAGLAYRTLLAIAAHAGESGAGVEAVDVLAGDAPGLRVDADKVHPIEAEEAIARGADATWAAQRYVDELERWLPRGAGGAPAFDVLLCGVGPDGHILSVFPDSPALEPDSPLVMAIPAPVHVEPHLARITLAPRVLPAAGLVLVIATGAGKADAIATVLGDERDPSRWPAQAAILPNSVWLLDAEAASPLTLVQGATDSATDPPRGNRRARLRR